MESKATLPELGYGYKELAPIFSEEQLHFHHAKHHQAYVNNLNNISAQIQEATKNNDFKTVAQLQPALRFNLGGHENHSMYWANLAPIGKGGGVLPGADSPLTKAIVQVFGSYENFIAEFNKKAGQIQGSGWGWLGYDKINKCLRLFELSNQEMPEFNGCIPLLTIDMWEHAFYIDYRNNKVSYLTEIWKIVNWAEVEKRFIKASL